MFGFIKILAALEEIFKLGIPLSEQDFLELEYYQYRRLKDDGYDISKKWYYISPDKNINSEGKKETLIINEEYKNCLLKAVAYINKETAESGIEFHTFKEKIFYIKSSIPPRFIPDDENSHEGKVIKLFGTSQKKGHENRR